MDIKSMIKSIMEWLTAGLTPVIAIVTAYIMYQQWRTNRTRLNYELYDRRLAVFKAVKAFFGEMGDAGMANYGMVMRFRDATAEAEFLFGDEISKHIEDLYKKGMNLASLFEKIYPRSGGPGLPVGPERSEVTDEFGNLLLWFQQDAVAKTRKLFGKYLRVD